MRDSSNASSGGFCGLLTIVFIVLKLTNYISWGWEWVLAPLWIPFAVVLFILLIVLIISVIKAIFER